MSHDKDTRIIFVPWHPAQCSSQRRSWGMFAEQTQESQQQCNLHNGLSQKIKRVEFMSLFENRTQFNCIFPMSKHWVKLFSCFILFKPQDLFFFFLFLNQFLLESGCFTMLCEFLVYSKMNHHIPPLFWISFPCRPPWSTEWVPCVIRWLLISCLFCT